MAKIRYSDEFICPKCGRHTALVCRIDGAHQAHCMICDVYYDVEIAKTTNADRIRAMTDEELAEFFTQYYYDGPKFYCPVQPVIGEGECAMRSDCRQCWLDWLKEECADG